MQRISSRLGDKVDFGDRPERFATRLHWRQLMKHWLRSTVALAAPARQRLTAETFEQDSLVKEVVH